MESGLSFLGLGAGLGLAVLAVLARFPGEPTEPYDAQLDDMRREADLRALGAFESEEEKKRQERQERQEAQGIVSDDEDEDEAEDRDEGGLVHAVRTSLECLCACRSHVDDPSPLRPQASRAA